MCCVLCVGVLGVHGAAHAEKSVHRIGLVDQGYEALVFRLHLIEQAQESVDIQTFIWENDECGKAFMQACVDAAQRGVRVRFLMDHIYSERDLDTALALAAFATNLEIRRYRPQRNRLNTGLHTKRSHLAISFPAHNQRMHNTVLIVDGRIALTGGRNISNHYFDYIADRNYLDRDVLITVPTIAVLEESFEAYWNFRRSIPQQELKDVKKALANPDQPKWIKTAESQHGVFLQHLYADLAQINGIDTNIQNQLQQVQHAWVSVDPPGKDRGYGFLGMQSGSQSAQDLVDLIKPAESSILIQSPYMIMGSGTKRVFRKLRKTQPEIEIDLITNSYASTGNMAAYSGAFRTRPNALRYGIHVHELKPIPEDLDHFMVNIEGQVATFDKYSVHAKSLVVDSQKAYVGSLNLDPGSIHLNTELGIVVEDEVFALALEEEIRLSLAPRNSWHVDYRELPLACMNRKAEWVSQHLPLDLWPIASTAVFESDQELGVLPVDDINSKKRWVFRLHKSLGFLFQPFL